MHAVIADLPQLINGPHDCALVKSASKTTNACTRGKTYDCEKIVKSGSNHKLSRSSSMWVQGACRGLFYCNEELVQCGACIGGAQCTRQTGKMHCRCPKHESRNRPMRCARRPSADGACYRNDCSLEQPPPIWTPSYSLTGPHSLEDAATCAVERSASQWCEDLLLLPTLLNLAAPEGGTFVEIGGLDGRTFSNTLMLEECFGWKGLLVEPNVVNFAKLNQSGRRARRVHSGACAPPQTSIPMTIFGGATAADKSHMSHRLRTMHSSGAVVDVPCAPLSSLMRDADLSTATFLSIDVEGAEDLVLSTVDPSTFQLIVVESDGFDLPKEARVHEILTKAGMQLSDSIQQDGQRGRQQVHHHSSARAPP